jgi:hypothetical protein
MFIFWDMKEKEGSEMRPQVTRLKQSFKYFAIGRHVKRQIMY